MPKPATELPNNQVKPDPALESVLGANSLLTISCALSPKPMPANMASLVLYCVVKNYTVINWQSGAVNTRSTDSKGYKKVGPGPTASNTPEQRQIAQLIKENEALTRQLDMANDCLSLLKKKPCRCSIICAVGAMRKDSY